MKTLRKTVMAVDDSITNLKYIEHILKNGFNIILKKSGSEAIEELNRMRDKPDLIMLDVNMPGMDGFETYKKIRENNANARIPVVFLTGETDSETEENGLELGADDFIIKPVDPITLQYRISRILEYDAMKKSLEQKLLDKEIESEKLMFQLIITISNTIDSRSGFMRYNSILVAQYAEEVAKRLGMNSEDIRKIKYMGLLHDIGMIVVPTTIISKP
ncbi:MAG: response regulator, partial [Lachnospiraceae bacterium]|nr:response regulator [Lachnospiraceae bacterium]